MTLHVCYMCDPTCDDATWVLHGSTGLSRSTGQKLLTLCRAGLNASGGEMGATDRENLYHAIKAAVLLLLLVTLGILVLRETPPELFDPEWIEEYLAEGGRLAPLVYVLIRVVAIVVSVVPNAPLDIVGGMLFGPFWGAVYSLLGSEAGAIACFLSPATLAGRRSQGSCTGISVSATGSPGAISHTSSCLPALSRCSRSPWSATGPA